MKLSPGAISALVVSTSCVVAYCGLTVWVWRTKDGSAWRTLCVLVTGWLVHSLCWLWMVIRTPTRYDQVPIALGILMFDNVVCAVLACVLALILRRAAQPRGGIS